jgi:hypothetical protein
MYLLIICCLLVTILDVVLFNLKHKNREIQKNIKERDFKNGVLTAISNNFLYNPHVILFGLGF